MEKEEWAKALSPQGHHPSGNSKGHIAEVRTGSDSGRMGRFASVDPPSGLPQPHSGAGGVVPGCA